MRVDYLAFGAAILIGSFGAFSAYDMLSTFNQDYLNRYLRRRKNEMAQNWHDEEHR